MSILDMLPTEKVLRSEAKTKAREYAAALPANNNKTAAAMSTLEQQQNKIQENKSMKQQHGTQLTKVMTSRQPHQPLITALKIFEPKKVTAKFAEIYRKDYSAKTQNAVDPRSSESNNSINSKGELFRYETNYVHAQNVIAPADVQHILAMAGGLATKEQVEDDLLLEYLSQQMDDCIATKEAAMRQALFTATQNVPFAAEEANKSPDFKADFNQNFSVSEFNTSPDANILNQFDQLVRKARTSCGSASTRVTGYVLLAGSGWFDAVTNHSSVSSARLLDDAKALLGALPTLAGYNTKYLKGCQIIDTAGELETYIKSNEAFLLPMLSGDSFFIQLENNTTRFSDRTTAPALPLFQTMIPSHDKKSTSVESEYSHLSINLQPAACFKLTLKAAK